ncbi:MULTISPECIES: hypothetical protein [Enterococcus]|uniref:hypothetical protein n=1 Tax=Enterococcus TaxID=1350 RepID=UPI00070BEF57|nr:MULTISPECIES: hypothetical protein [Enterococcus]EKK5254024.1 hypothetical protein [Enterococcus faecalis]KXF69237.1 hypothetical protein AQ486_14900 [Enterococcus faecalis]KXF74230.1 hypothetical protein AQ487_02350 [Enterococcus faecalis]MBC2811793.1 hypothetical protein [Enterococcus faecalis]MBC2816046.1 hypothetical protein [Enterococcus faecalis]
MNKKKVFQNKQKIKAIRAELLYLMSLNENWYNDETSELYKKIMECSRKLREATNDKRKIQKMSLDEYTRLRSLGYTLNEIADYYGISLSYLNKWRKEKGKF